MSSKKKYLDLYLLEVFKQFIAIKDDDYRKSKEVFDGVFEQVKAKMGEQCNYFRKYGSQVMYAGSVADGIKVSKLDEFDMDLVIRLPVSYEDIGIEPDQPGFVRLKIESPFDNLDKQPEWEKCHKVTREWRDAEKYLLQSKFRQWMHGIVQKALNEMNSQVVVNDVTYTLKYKESGPAWTLNIQDDGVFKLDVDLVPVIRFMHPRWPEGYREVNESIVKEWLVVPKPNKALSDEGAKGRCWRLSFQDFERDIIKGCQQLKTTIRLVKKLRDSLQMKAIASYYIKTVFLWRVDKEKEKKYWHKSIGVIFRIMVEDLYNALVKRNIPYFWHEHNNLIENVKPTVLKGYTDKLKEVLDAIDSNNPDKLASYLLTTNEYQEFKKSDFYINIQQAIKKRAPSPNILNAEVHLFRQESNISITSSASASQSDDISIADSIKALAEKIDAMNGDNEKRTKKIEADIKTAIKNKPVTDMLKTLEDKLDTVINKYNEKEAKLVALEKETKIEREALENKIDALIDKLDIQEDRMKSLEVAVQALKSKDETCKMVFENDKTRYPVLMKLDNDLVGSGEMVLNYMTDTISNIMEQ